MKISFKYIIGFVLIVAAFFGGMYVNTKPQIIKEKIVETSKNIIKDRVTKKVDKNGQPIIITERTTDKSVVNEAVKEDVKNRKVGFNYVLPTDLEKGEGDYIFNAGLRVYKSWWLEGGYRFKSKEISVGISKEF